MMILPQSCERLTNRHSHPQAPRASIWGVLCLLRSESRLKAHSSSISHIAVIWSKDILTHLIRVTRLYPPTCSYSNHHSTSTRFITTSFSSEGIGREMDFGIYTPLKHHAAHLTIISDRLSVYQVD